MIFIFEGFFKEMQDMQQNVRMKIIKSMYHKLLRYSHFLELPATAQAIMDVIKLAIMVIIITAED